MYYGCILFATYDQCLKLLTWWLKLMYHCNAISPERSNFPSLPLKYANVGTNFVLNFDLLLYLMCAARNGKFLPQTIYKTLQGIRIGDI